MTLRTIIAAAAITVSACASAQIANTALALTPQASVDCGPMPELNSRNSYTIQLWAKPTAWAQGAALLTLGDDLAITLGAPGTVECRAGEATYSASIPQSGWSLITFRVNDGKAYINGTRKSTPAPALPDQAGKLTIGGGFDGLIDEVRIWSTGTLDSRFNDYAHTTLNQFNPDWDNLVAYYKMDGANTEVLADFKSLHMPERAYNHHAWLPADGTSIVPADNDALPYLLNGAYTANERFFDRAVPREQYLLSNDIIILGIESFGDGHLRTVNPNNHASFVGSAKWSAELDGRNGVALFDGQGHLDLGTDMLRNGIIGFEAWLRVDKWVPGAYIYRKETDDAKHGLSIRLGEESNHEIIVRVNGNNFVNQRLMKAGQWIHLAIGPNGEQTPGRALWWLYNANNIGYGSSKCDDSYDVKPTGHEACHGLIGEGFIGAMDNIAFWDSGVQRSDVPAHAQGNYPMPALGKAVTAGTLMSANTLLLFDNPDNPGWSSYSQDQWLAIIKSAYDGYSGYQIRISVKSHDNWTTTIANAAKRKIFAADLAEISKPYDGVELDLEWMYGTQTNLGLLAQEIRAALPQGKTFMVSCHNVAYGFPKDKMQYCDGFTFQQYGPQNQHFKYSHYTSMIKTFASYGFPNSKIIGSYSTTTSKGYKDGNAQLPIKGVKDGFVDYDGYTPNAESESKTIDGYEYWFTGPLQTYNRAKYITDNRYGGIFYWDMGNDSPVQHPYNLAKWCSYGLNANVDPDDTGIAPEHPTQSVRNVAADAASLTITLNGSVAHLNGSATLEAYTPGGTLAARLNAANGSADLADLPNGIYILRATAPDGATATARIALNK